MEIVKNRTTGEPNYEELDRPTINRRTPKKVANGGTQAEDMDYLDIPAFLRRQAD